MNCYLQHLWTSGTPYWRASETLNAVISLRSEIRRSMHPSWDTLRQWQVREPGEHHIAMPTEILRALVAVAALWGWLRVAVLVAAGRSGLMRLGEFLHARRRNLILPADAFSLGLTLY